MGLNGNKNNEFIPGKDRIESSLKCAKCGVCNNFEKDCIEINILGSIKYICCKCGLQFMLKMFSLSNCGSSDTDKHRVKDKVVTHEEINKIPTTFETVIVEAKQSLYLTHDEYCCIMACESGIKDDELLNLENLKIENILLVKKAAYEKLKLRKQLESDPLGLINLKSDPLYRKRKQWMRLKIIGINTLAISRILKVHESTFYKMVDKWEDEERIRWNIEIQ
jgi:hypothetical protein